MTEQQNSFAKMGTNGSIKNSFVTKDRKIFIIDGDNIVKITKDQLKSLYGEVFGQGEECQEQATKRLQKPL